MIDPSAPSSKVPSPHLTVRIALELMAVDCSTTRYSTKSKTPRPSLASTSTQRQLVCVQAALAAQPCIACSESKTAGTSLHAHQPPTASAASTTTSSSSSSSVKSEGSFWDEDNEEDEKGYADDDDSGFEWEDRGRLLARVGVRFGSFSREDRLETSVRSLISDDHQAAADWRTLEEDSFDEYPVGYFRHDKENKPSVLDEVDHPSLIGAVAALHGYMASGGDVVFLEKAYDLARSVAGSKHNICVALNACRLALAVGYVHTLKKGSLEMAIKFATNHSLPKLVLSLKPYWAKGLAGRNSSLFEEMDWEECMLSLLEVTSSVSLLAGEKNIMSVLDDEVRDGVADAMGLFCVMNPGILSLYTDVGCVCTSTHLASLSYQLRRQAVVAIKREVYLKSPRLDHTCCSFAESE